MDYTGTTLGHYRIDSKIGEGGMGVVYRAHDTRLDRIVALKFVRAEVAAQPERLNRFRQEAVLLAALNHPNIGAIYGLEEQAGQFYLVLEFVDGETLAQRLQRGPLATRETVQFCRQIAKALSEAHEKGIIHRDLKPSNIKLTPDGSVKVLDFGVAKALSKPRGEDPETDTREGTVLGTLGYMSPEQMLGQPVTRSADIWAFGCVLVEMLSGQPAFRRTTPSEIRAAVLRGEPDWSSLPSGTPAALRTLAAVCLELDPMERLRHVGDARLLLDAAATEIGTGGSDARRVDPKPPSWRPWAAVVLTMLSVVVGYWLARVRLPVEAPGPVRLALAPPPGLEPVLAFGPTVAISPDGRTVAFVWENGTGPMLYLKRPEDLEARPMTGTRGARSPFFSPTSQWVGFYDEDDRRLKRVSVGGGEPAAIASSNFLRGAVWAPDDSVVFAAADGLFRVAADGGEPVRVTTAELGPHMWPELLRGGNVVLFSRLSTKGSFDEADIVAVDLRGGPAKVVISGAYYARYVPTGHLVFVQGDSLLAAPFDEQAVSVTGPAVTLLKNVWTSSWTGYADFAISATGTLVYVAGGPHPATATLASVDRLGASSPLVNESRAYRVPRVSPDGRHVAVTLVDRQVDIWTYDLSRNVLNRLTDSPSWDAYPIWDPLMQWVAFSSTRDGVAAIYRQHLRANTVEKLVATASPTYPNSWSGRLLAYEEANPQTGLDLWVYSFDSGTSTVFLRTPFNESKAEFSPDGRFIAYESTEDGQQTEVYVRPYPAVNPRRKVSTNGGTSPRWGPRGSELYYRIAGRVLAVPMKLTPDVQVGRPRELVAGPYGGYDPSPNGQAFVVVQHMLPGDPPTRINLVMNWFDELKRAGAPR
jgi:eukaryotic-like serine/threonine-protein kinase